MFEPSVTDQATTHAAALAFGHIEPEYIIVAKEQQKHVEHISQNGIVLIQS